MEQHHHRAGESYDIPERNLTMKAGSSFQSKATLYSSVFHFKKAAHVTKASTRNHLLPSLIISASETTTAIGSSIHTLH
jgi:hypothetical protein